jgi:hypothetical protein
MRNTIPRSRILAHPPQLTRPDDASAFGDEGPHLAGEVDGPVGFREGVGRRHAWWVVRARSYHLDLMQEEKGKEVSCCKTRKTHFQIFGEESDVVCQILAARSSIATFYKCGDKNI